MKSFKKFIFIALIPILLISIVSVIVKKSFDDLRHFHFNIFVFGFFGIISFCYVYIFEKQKQKNQSKILTYTFSVLALSSLLFLFCNITLYCLFSDFNFKITMFQNILGICIFLTITFAFEIYKQSNFQNALIVNEKPLYFGKIIAQITLILSFILGVLTIDSYIDEHKPQQIATIILNIVAFNLTIVLVSFVSLAFFYSIFYFRKNVILATFFASLLSCALNFSLNFLIHNNIFIGYPQLFAMCFFCCFLITIIIVYKSKIQNLSLSFSKKETEYLQLKNQINPHFLFNNLNTLIAFIEINPQKAIDFGMHLSNIYRHYLKDENNDFVKLEDEINFIKEYTAIFKAKFENGFTFEVKNKATSNQYILSLSLQELIDNIFKHNILDTENPIAIEISIQESELIIRNTKHKKQALNSTNKGLENISKRYKLLVRKEISITDSTDFFEVKIPILHLSI